jgi:actin-related protein 9
VVVEEVEEIIENGKRATADEESEFKRQRTPEAESAAEPISGTVVSSDAGAAPSTEAPVTETSVVVEDQTAKREQARAAKREEKREEKRKAREGADDAGIVRREIEVGTERFLAASGGLLDAVADAVHRTVLSVEDVSKRSELWDSVIIVGNGCRVRGEQKCAIRSIFLLCLTHF